MLHRFSIDLSLHIAFYCCFFFFSLQLHRRKLDSCVVVKLMRSHISWVRQPSMVEDGRITLWFDDLKRVDILRCSGWGGVLIVYRIQKNREFSLHFFSISNSLRLETQGNVKQKSKKYQKKEMKIRLVGRVSKSWMFSLQMDAAEEGGWILTVAQSAWACVYTPAYFSKQIIHISKEIIFSWKIIYWHKLSAFNVSISSVETTTQRWRFFHFRFFFSFILSFLFPSTVSDVYIIALPITAHPIRCSLVVFACGTWGDALKTHRNTMIYFGVDNNELFAQRSDSTTERWWFASYGCCLLSDWLVSSVRGKLASRIQSRFSGDVKSERCWMMQCWCCARED